MLIVITIKSEVMPQKEEPAWKNYETITQYIYGALGEKDGIKVIGYGRNCKVKGKSGISYQIDVLTEQSDGEITHRTAIECKFRKKKVTNDVVMKLRGIMEDAEIESGIIVCKTGFTRDTLVYAEHHGIKLVELREAGENDSDFKRTLEIGDLDIRMKITRSRANMTKIDLGTKVITGERELMAMYYARLHDTYGREIPFSKYIAVFSDELKSRGDLPETATIDVPTGGKLYWRQPGNDITVEKIAITGFYSTTDLSSTRSFRLIDQVWLIMKDLFNNRNLTMSKSGGIWNLPSDN